MNKDIEIAFENATCAYCCGNFPDAFLGFSKLATIGHSRAIAYLAEMYLRGEHIERNTNEGLQLLKRAANLGNGNAAYNLAALHKSGDHGVVVDTVASKAFFCEAKRLGCDLEE